jgi:hypothetical protein
MCPPSIRWTFSPEHCHLLGAILPFRTLHECATCPIPVRTLRALENPRRGMCVALRRG